jgi:hypothetical protein
VHVERNEDCNDCGGSSYTPELIEGYILRKDGTYQRNLVGGYPSGKEKLKSSTMAKRQVSGWIGQEVR